MMPVTVRESSPYEFDARQLISELDHYLQALYPAESNHLDDLATLAADNVTFVLAFHDGKVVGCGAVKQMGDEYGEIKRMYVSQDVRGLGVGKALLSYLEKTACQKGLGITRLETGIHQKEAIGLFKKLGYKNRAPFGNYQHDPLSLFMEKKLI